jgi:hypothetical protein
VGAFVGFLVTIDAGVGEDVVGWVEGAGGLGAAEGAIVGAVLGDRDVGDFVTGAQAPTFEEKISLFCPSRKIRWFDSQVQAFAAFGLDASFGTPWRSATSMKFSPVSPQ